MNPRHPPFALFSLALALLLSFATAVTAQDAAPSAASDRAVERGLEYLRRCQNPDGSFDASPGVTGLAAMAFLARGHVPGSGPDGDRVERALTHLVNRQSANGYFGDNFRGMYSQGVCTLLLAEAAGMSKNPQLLPALRKACDLILRAQAVEKPDKHAGGWRYEPTANDSDVTVTAWQLLALRAAKDCGIKVPASAIDSAVEYIKRCAVPEGGFFYMPGVGVAEFARTGCGMVSLQMCGEYEAPEVRRALEWIREHERHPALEFRGPTVDYYGYYYVTQAMYQCGGEAWQWWKPRVEQILLAQQTANGGWTRGANAPEKPQAAAIYSTSMAVLALCVQYHYLPAYQR